MRAAKTVKNLKETVDKLYCLVGNLATTNAIFLYNNGEMSTEHKTAEEFIKELDSMDAMNNDLNSLTASVKEVINNIKNLKR